MGVASYDWFFVMIVEFVVGHDGLGWLVVLHRDGLDWRVVLGVGGLDLRVVP
jgi:ABC-type nitrate/sulfonate/bicarbonate transport system permease component